MTQADRPEFSRLELDEDGELVGVRVVGARHAGEDFARARLVDVELVRCDLSGCDFTEAHVPPRDARTNAGRRASRSAS